MANGKKTAAIVARINEPSTWAGLSALLMLFGLEVEAAHHVATVASALAGTVAILMGEGGGHA